MEEAVEYMAHRSEEVEEGVSNRSSRGGVYRPGSTSEELCVLKIPFLEEQVTWDWVVVQLTFMTKNTANLYFSIDSETGTKTGKCQ